MMMAEREHHHHLPNGEHEPPFCIFCLKECLSESRDSFQNRSRNKNYHVPIERFLGLQLFSNNSDNGLSFQTCRDCSLLLDKFAALYGTWRRVELELEWRIGKIRDIMVCADRVPSRIAFVRGRGYYSDKGRVASGWKQVQEWRGKLVRKCGKKLLEGFPQIKLRKLEEEEESTEALLHSRNGTCSTGTLSLPDKPDPQAVGLKKELERGFTVSSPDLHDSIGGTENQAYEQIQVFAPPSTPYVIAGEMSTLLPPTVKEINAVECHQHFDTKTSATSHSAVFVVSTPSKTVGNMISEEFGGFSGGPEECDDDDDYHSFGDEPMEMTEDLQDYSSVTGGAFQADLPQIAPIIKTETVLIGGVDEDASSSVGSNSTEEETNSSTAVTEERPQSPSPSRPMKKEFDGGNDDDPCMSRLRPQFRCQKCSRTFSSKVRFESHQEKSHREVAHVSSDHDEPGELSSDSEYQNDENSDTDEDDDDARSSSENEEDCDDDDGHDLKDETAKSHKGKMRAEGEQGDCSIGLPIGEGDDAADGNKGCYSCSICKIRYTVKEWGPKHYSTHHDKRKAYPNQRKVYRCEQDQCAAYFIRKTQLEKHAELAHLGKSTRMKGGWHHHSCSTCKSTFSSKGNLQMHWKSHHDDTHTQGMDFEQIRKKCVQAGCSAYFRTALQLQKHVETVHLRNFQCSVCSLGFTSDCSLDIHYKSHHDTRLYQIRECREAGCSAYFLTSNQLRKHLESFHPTHRKSLLAQNKEEFGLTREEGDFTCSVCKKSFIYPHSLLKHQRVYHPVSATTNMDDDDHLNSQLAETSTSWTTAKTADGEEVVGKDLRNDINHGGDDNDDGGGSQSSPPPHKTGKLFPCSICRYPFTCQKSQTKHYKSHHDKRNLNGTQVYSCPESQCSAYFIRPIQLEKHRELFHVEKARVLSSFYKKSKRRLSLSSSENRNYNFCSICKRRFVTKWSLKNHYRADHNNKLPYLDPSSGNSYSCSVCEACFPTRQQERKHYGTHHDKRKAAAAGQVPLFTCDEAGCSAYFIRPRQLGRHRELAHEQCNLLLRKSDWDCSVCNARFGGRSNLDEHTKTHHDTRGLKPRQIHKCKERDCSAYFITPTQLARHQLSAHPRRQRRKNNNPTQSTKLGKYCHCPVCRLGFFDKKNMASHYKSHHDTTPYQILECGQEGCSAYFLVAAQLRKHMEFHRRGARKTGRGNSTNQEEIEVAGPSTFEEDSTTQSAADMMKVEQNSGPRQPSSVEQEEGPSAAGIVVASSTPSSSFPVENVTEEVGAEEGELESCSSSPEAWGGEDEGPEAELPGVADDEFEAELGSPVAAPDDEMLPGALEPPRVKEETTGWRRSDETQGTFHSVDAQIALVNDVVEELSSLEPTNEILSTNKVSEVQVIQTSRLRAKFRCQHCTKTFSTQNSLDAHLESHNEPEDNSNDGLDDPDDVSSGSEYQNDKDSDSVSELSSSEGEQDFHEDIEDEDNIPCSPTGSRAPITPIPPPLDSNEPEEPSSNLDELGEFLCSICKLPFSTKRAIKLHYNSHHDTEGGEGLEEGKPVVYKCRAPHCSAYFLHQRQLDRHEGLFHETRPNLKYSRKRRGRMRMPELKEDDEKPIICPICTMRFNFKQNLYAHCRSNHDTRKVDDDDEPAQIHKCGESGCSAYFLTPVQLQNHLKLVHEKSKSIRELQLQTAGEYADGPDCSANMPLPEMPEDLKILLAKYSPRKKKRWSKWTRQKGTHQLRCKICKATAPSSNYLRTHYNVMHNLKGLDEAEVHRCEEPGCSAYFRTKRQLDHHKSSATHDDDQTDQLPTSAFQNQDTSEEPPAQTEPRESFPCSTCKLPFATKGGRQTHVKSHHGGDSNADVDMSQVYKCEADQCSAYFLLSTQLERHRELFHGSGKSMMASSARKRVGRPCRPLSLEKLQYKHSCSVCNARFTLRFNLNSHYRSHHHGGSRGRGERVAEGEGAHTHKCSEVGCSAYFLTGAQLQLQRHCATWHKRENKEPGKKSGCIHPAAGPPKKEGGTEGSPSKKQKPHPALTLAIEDDDKQDLGEEEPLKILPPKIRDDRWCSMCQLEFTSLYLYRRHYGLHHDLSNVENPEAVLRCTQDGCTAYYLLPFQLRDHLFRAHGLGLNNEKRIKFVCSVCHKSFTDKGSRRKHFVLCHDFRKLQNPDDVFKCDQPGCTAYFLQRRQLELHRGEFHGKWYECSNCRKEFRNRKDLRKHRYTTHKNELDLQFSCGVEGCSRKFESEEHLRWHTNFHKKNDSEPLSCPKCDKVIKGKEALKMHMFCHGERRKPRQKIMSWVCEQCGKVFKEKDRLAIHYKSHAGAESWEFQCSTCGKKCISKQKLEEHLRTHTGEKPYCCEHCGVSYAHKHNLRIHVNSKHPEVPDLPRPFDKTNLSSRKGVKLRK